MTSFSAYALPNIWGPWVNIASHTASVSFKISADPVGSTVLRCRVRYFKGKGGGSQIIEEFIDNVTITTSNSVAIIEVSFMGIPTGSAVDGTIEGGGY